MGWNWNIFWKGHLLFLPAEMFCFFFFWRLDLWIWKRVLLKRVFDVYLFLLAAVSFHFYGTSPPQPALDMTELICFKCGEISMNLPLNIRKVRPCYNPERSDCCQWCQLIEVHYFIRPEVNRTHHTKDSHCFWGTESLCLDIWFRLAEWQMSLPRPVFWTKILTSANCNTM